MIYLKVLLDTHCHSVRQAALFGVIKDATKSGNTMAAKSPYSEAVFTVDADPERGASQDNEKSSTPSPVVYDHSKESHIPESPVALSDGGKRDLENPNDGLFHKVIVKNGEDVLVSWTREEQARVVRKADFLFLPLFAVRIC